MYAMDSIETGMETFEISIISRMGSLERNLSARMLALESRMIAVEKKMNVLIALTVWTWATTMGALITIILRM